METVENSTKSTKTADDHCRREVTKTYASNKCVAKKTTIVKPCRKMTTKQKQVLNRMEKILECARKAEKRGNAKVENSTKSKKADEDHCRREVTKTYASRKCFVKKTKITKPCRKRKKEQKKVLNGMEKMLECARKAEKRGNACVYRSRTEENRGECSSSSDTSVPKTSTLSYRIITSSANSCEGISPNENMILIKPLIVLDLNGILCRRVRHYNNVELISNELKQQFRPFIGRVAGTPIISRMDLGEFLSKLDARFTLAVWSSAQKKTVMKLVDLLFPRDIAERLLFVWGQNYCVNLKSPGNKDRLVNGADAIFSKPLCKVWSNFPLWNSRNTILIDDSPDKCVDFKGNTINPPPMKGISTLFEAGCCEVYNQRQQGELFDKLADHFKPGYECHDATECNFFSFLRDIIPNGWSSDNAS